MDNILRYCAHDPAKGSPPNKAETQVPDEELVALVLEGNQDAFEALMERYGPVVRGFLTRRGLQREDTEDLYQEIFVSAYQKIAALREPTRFGPWLIKISKNRLLNHYRGRMTWQRMLARPGLGEESGGDLIDRQRDESPGPIEQASLLSMRESVMAAIGKLSVRYRMVVYLTLIDEMPPVEIAARLDMKESTVRMRLLRGLGKLRKTLINMGVTPPGTS